MNAVRVPGALTRELTEAERGVSDGDIFRWRYKDEKPSDLGPYKRYHCKSQICVAKNGMLRDTYWHTGGSDEAWTYEVAQETLCLEYIGNFSDLQKTDEGKAEFYDDADCVNLNHPNSSRGNFYLRNGAARSRVKMLEVATYKKGRAESDARFASQEAARLGSAIEAIEAGADLNDIWL